MAEYFKLHFERGTFLTRLFRKQRRVRVTGNAMGKIALHGFPKEKMGRKAAENEEKMPPSRVTR